MRKRFQRFEPLRHEPTDLPERVSMRVYLAAREAESDRERRSQNRLAVIVWSVILIAAGSLLAVCCLAAWWLIKHPTR